jgi:hypothetical protein
VRHISLGFPCLPFFRLLHFTASFLLDPHLSYSCLRLCATCGFFHVSYTYVSDFSPSFPILHYMFDSVVDSFDMARLYLNPRSRS